MKTPSVKKLAEIVLRDIVRENNADKPGTIKYRDAHFLSRRTTCFLYFVLLGWGFYFYPFWMFADGSRWLGWIKHPNSAEKGEQPDVTVRLLIFGFDVLPYKVRKSS